MSLESRGVMILQTQGSVQTLIFQQRLKNMLFFYGLFFYLFLYLRIMRTQGAKTYPSE